jgi:hypothetical protein
VRRAALRASRHGAIGAMLAITASLAAAWPAHAWIPAPESAWGFVATSNSNAGRTGVLKLDVALVGADGAVAATGTARLDPNGVAKLGLTYGDGTVEVHERTPTAYTATRGGASVDHPLRLIPPVALLQAASGLAVADRLRAIGGDPALVDLGMEGDHDCWVLGGRDMGSFDSNSRVSLWVDQDSQQPIRIDDGAGTQYRFGLPAAKEGVRFPAWIDVRAAGFPSWRLDVRSVSKAP